MNFEAALKPIFIDGLNIALNWYRGDDNNYLKSVFSSIGFKDKLAQDKEYYLPPNILSYAINYPADNLIDFTSKKQEILEEINKNYNGFKNNYLDNLNANQLFFFIGKILQQRS